MGIEKPEFNICTGRHLEQLETLYEISKVFATHSDQREMLRNILGILENKMNMSHATIMLLTADGNELVLEAANDPQHLEKNAKYRLGEGIIGRTLETKKAEVVPLVANEPRFKGRIYKRDKGKDGDFSFICVPISSGNETVGTLSVDIPVQSEKTLLELKRMLSIVASVIANDVYQRRIALRERENLENENRRLRDELGGQYRPENIIGNSNAMKSVYLRIHQVASSDTTVIIRGDSGTGKEMAASAIHYNSARADKPFIKVNCAALSENLLESELFGHMKGAFTGAASNRIGRIEQAEGGTLFLDEIGDFSPAVQVKLLRVIQEKEYEMVGSNETKKANVRIICATNRDLEEAVREHSFRQDLYYRINVFPIFIPPLRERKDDILLLVNHFLEKYSKIMGRNIRRVSTPAINMLTAYHWPGNVRELENCIEHAMLLANNGVIHGHDLPPTLQMPDMIGENTPQTSMKATVMVVERDMIVDALKRSNGNICAAARELGITGRMVRYKIEKLGIDYQKLFKKKKKS
jgi:Nif-specific regulatory protein